MKLTQEDIDNWENAQKFEQKILDRIDYIIKTIYQTFGRRLSYWYFYGAGEGEVGNIPAHALKPGGYISPVCNPHKDTMVHLKNERVVDLLGDGFPSRWLYEDFEDELKLGKNNYIKHIEDEKARKKERAEQNKVKKEEGAKKRGEEIKALMAKLSPEERKLLKGLG